jgi:hypothetical protein
LKYGNKTGSILHFTFDILHVTLNLPTLTLHANLPTQFRHADQLSKLTIN